MKHIRRILSIILALALTLTVPRICGEYYGK